MTKTVNIASVEEDEVVGFLNPQPLPPFPNPEAFMLRVGPGPGDPYRAQVSKLHSQLQWGQIIFQRFNYGAALAGRVGIIER